MRQIQVFVTKEGEVTIKPIGFAGDECKQATKKREDVLGTVTKDSPTPERGLGTFTKGKQNVDTRR